MKVKEGTTTPFAVPRYAGEILRTHVPYRPSTCSGQPYKPPAKRHRGQAKPKTEALLTEKDLGTGTIHWNGLLAMLTKINKSDEEGTTLVQGSGV